MPRRPGNALHGLFAAAPLPVLLTAFAGVLLGLLVAVPAAGDDDEAAYRSPPNVLLVSIDTLRADRLSGYGYHRPTSPQIDRLIHGGVRFDQARTVEPLTSPATASMLTSLYPHEHGSTRNGLAIRSGLPSLTRELDRRGYQTAAFVANWTIKDKMSGLGEHFQHYEEILTKKRWFGLVAGEATAEDVNEAALAWLDEHAGRRRPFLAWVHFVEPHAPYRFQGDVAARVGVRDRSEADRSDRYDTEIAYVDHFVGQLVDRIESDPRLDGNTLVVFLSDHGESLGEHGYWGHGRKLYEPGLHIPLVLYWPGRLERRVVTDPASILDVAPTVLGLLDHEIPSGFRGFDWTPVLAGEAKPDPSRPFWFQAHKGAVLDVQESQEARRQGLMELGLLRDGKKEIVQVNRKQHKLFDLRRDPGERNDLSGDGFAPSEDLQGWMDHVEQALADSADAPPVNLNREDIEKLKSLGYVD